MGNLSGMERALSFVLVTLAVASALPLQGETTALADTTSLPRPDDDSVVQDSVEKAIQTDINMGAMTKVGEAIKAGAKDAWSKRAMSAIKDMSASEMKSVRFSDKLSTQFAQDSKAASSVIKKSQPAPKGKKKKVTKLSPAEKKALKEDEVQAEAEFFSPTTLIQKNESAELGESGIDLGETEADAQSKIESRIKEQVAKQLGAMPVDTGGAQLLQKFEEDAKSAELATDSQQKVAKVKKAAKAAAMAQLKKAAAALREAQEADADADEKDENDEVWSWML